MTANCDAIKEEEEYIVTEIKKYRIRWAYHVKRMIDGVGMENVSNGDAGRRRRRGRPRKRQVEDVGENLHLSLIHI